MPAKDATTEPGGFSAAERAAMKKRAAELRAEGKKGAQKADGLQAVLDSIAEMAPADRALAERLPQRVGEVPAAPVATPHGITSRHLSWHRSSTRPHDRGATAAGPSEDLGRRSGARLVVVSRRCWGPTAGYCPGSTGGASAR